MPNPKKSPTPRQQRGQRTAARILDAATEVFMRAGFAGASMDAITRTAGVSKATVYSHFPSKELLFGAIVRTRCAELLAPLRDADVPKRRPEVALAEIARGFVDLVMSEPALALYRVVLAEAPRFPELARVFYENGPAQAIASLAAYLEQEAERGRLDIADPVTAAEQFFNLLTGYPQMRALLGIERTPGRAKLDRHVKRTLAMFLRAYGTPPRPRS